MEHEQEPELEQELEPECKENIELKNTFLYIKFHKIFIVFYT